MNDVSISTQYDLEKIKKRNPFVLNRIYREYRDIVFKFLIVRTRGNKTLAEELTCETFHSAIKSAPKLKNLKNIKAWLFQIAYRRLVDHYRKKTNEIKFNDDFDIYNLTDESCIIENIEKKYEDLIFDNAIKRLKTKYKEVIILRYINNLGIKEISKQLGTNKGVVHSLLTRAKVSLKKEYFTLINMDYKPIRTD